MFVLDVTLLLKRRQKIFGCDTSSIVHYYIYYNTFLITLACLNGFAILMFLFLHHHAMYTFGTIYNMFTLSLLTGFLGFFFGIL